MKYSEGVNTGHLILSEQKPVHQCTLCITSEWPQAPWALQIPQVKSSWSGSVRKQRQPFHLLIPTSGPITPQPWERRWISARCPSRTAARRVTGAALPTDSCFLSAAGRSEKAPRRSRKSEGESNSEERPGSTRALKRQEARVRSRNDPFPAALIRGVAEASCSLRARLCVCRHFRFASPWEATACPKADLFCHQYTVFSLLSAL